ncbi:hypothetical protein ACOMHN_034992 [Nucella lapillus]
MLAQTPLRLRTWEKLRRDEVKKGFRSLKSQLSNEATSLPDNITQDKLLKKTVMVIKFKENEWEKLKRTKNSLHAQRAQLLAHLRNQIDTLLERRIPRATIQRWLEEVPIPPELLTTSLIPFPHASPSPSPSHPHPPPSHPKDLPGDEGDGGSRNTHTMSEDQGRVEDSSNGGKNRLGAVCQPGDRKGAQGSSRKRKKSGAACQQPMPGDGAQDSSGRGEERSGAPLDSSKTSSEDEAKSRLGTKRKRAAKGEEEEDSNRVPARGPEKQHPGHCVQEDRMTSHIRKEQSGSSNSSPRHLSLPHPGWGDEVDGATNLDHGDGLCMDVPQFPVRPAMSLPVLATATPLLYPATNLGKDRGSGVDSEVMGENSLGLVITNVTSLRSPLPHDGEEAAHSN